MLGNKINKRVESEQQAMVAIENKNLVCKDCLFRFNDKEKFGNAFKCEQFAEKPNKVILGGKCDEYIKE